MVARHFSAIATRYDLANDVLSLGLQRRWKRTATALLDLRPGDLVLDVCGGTADLALLAAPRVAPDGLALVYDFNPNMLAVGRAKALRHPHGREVAFLQGDAQEMALRDNCLDAAIVGFGLRNLTRLQQGLKEMHRVLKPGGRLVILEFSQPPARWFRLLYDLYSHTVIPLVGKILAGSREAYTYLTTSIRHFPTPEELTATLEETGFSQITCHPLTQGIAMIHRGVKG
ncbi:MAG: bifunctional demethylmenaquinone methyltransferase/2-methoxy-6-polyprenyl-1,4-benzoquinol methylase UbiE [Deltaproteobacteria bacterium]|nr:bifunctional demethylmenaquinone methyltransferase/2-methoxy-6-polyprenyl-1,4-benzoquinol methylase UbiE [Deltaproteobacteria bacterium]